MKKDYVTFQSLPEFPLWKKMTGGRPLFSFDFDLTARCNQNCRHCYINLPASDAAAREKELSLAEIDRIATEAVSLGAFWCLISGGEPLLREDFAKVYLLLKKRVCSFRFSPMRRSSGSPMSGCSRLIPPAISKSRFTG